MNVHLAGSLRDPDTDIARERWKENDYLSRMWSGDPTVFGPPGTPEIANRLGWLRLPFSSRAIIDDLTALHEQAAEDGISTVLLCGMGGSSLAPEVFSSDIPPTAGQPNLVVIDTTHPDEITRVTDELVPETTWVIVASKSGGTIETMSAMHHFWEIFAGRMDDPGRHFIAITDEGSRLSDEATRRGFRAVFHADSDVGGRYSALTHFGLVPAAIIGVDIDKLLGAARTAAALCSPDTPLDSNPAFVIGAALGTRARNGRDKARFIATGSIGAWAEQLLAESTGKNGTGIVPIDGGTPPDPSDETLVTVDAAFEGAEISFELETPEEIAAVMFILEAATAIAGEILDINPFDQPDVQRAKDLAGEALAGTLEDSTPPVPVADPKAVRVVAEAASSATNYVAIQAFIARNERADRAVHALRSAIVAAFGIPVTVGYGPRFLHSTGQLHKGGPEGAAFLQFVDVPSSDVPIPGADSTFGQLIAGQATGDRSALHDADRTVVGIDLGPDPAAALERLAASIPVTT